ncbi:MAG: Tim44 domain-containing protein [Alphaproteobacteria bacterium]|nr:Tim44 domain-containing protein [Alphaproteobacteria bacterium]
MSDGSFIEILILAVVAGFIGLKLYGTLGRRTGHEDSPPRPTGPREPGTDKVVPLPRAAAPEGRVADDDSGLTAALTQIKIADPGFERETFLAGAKAAFEIIVNSFAKGDLDAMKGLVSGSVLASFGHAVRERQEAKHTREMTLIAVDDAVILEAELDRRVARITVRLRSEQTDVTHDAGGTIVDGDPRGPRRVEDIWTFERDTRSRDPNWALVATRSPN